MFFVGIDLAWSEKNKSGVAVLEGTKKQATFIHGAVVQSDDEILAFVREHVKDDSTFVAVDAPLIVPNQQGRRVAEKVVGELFRKYHAGAHPANRERLAQWSGTIRGEVLAQKLVAEGFVHDPYVQRYEAARKVFEVYPHPSMVVLF